MLLKIKNIFSFEFEGKSKKEIRREQLLALGSGLAMGISFPPLPFYLIAFLALVPLLKVWEKRESLASINRATYFFGLGFTLVTLYWVGSWTKDADPFLMLSGTALIFFNPLLFLIPSTLFYFVRKKINLNTALYSLPFFWIFYEHIYSITDLRFPWIVLGHGMAYFQSYIQIAGLIGSMGISFLIVITNVFVFKIFNSPKEFRARNFAISLMLIFLPVLYGFIKISGYQKSENKIKVGIVQPNLNPWKKWDAGSLQEQVALYTGLSKQAVDKNADLILWPETALPVYLRNRGYTFERETIFEFLNANSTCLITGMPDSFVFKDKSLAPEDAKRFRNSDTYYTSYNSLWGLTPFDKKIQAYQKVKLVPFGEFTPFAGSIPFLRDFIQWGVGIGNWNIGKDVKLMKFPGKYFNLQQEELKVGGVICIESIFQGFVSEFVDKGADFITVVTNDSWYGNSSGPRQHKVIGILRAVENGRSVVRCANGGISCIISPLGEIKKETEMFTEDVLVGEVELKKEKTFFTRYPNLLPYISVIFTILILLIAFVIKKKNEK